MNNFTREYFCENWIYVKCPIEKPYFQNLSWIRQILPKNGKILPMVKQIGVTFGESSHFKARFAIPMANFENMVF
jgi:hypothetical protein